MALAHLSFPKVCARRFNALNKSGEPIIDYTARLVVLPTCGGAMSKLRFALKVSSHAHVPNSLAHAGLSGWCVDPG